MNTIVLIQPPQNPPGNPGGPDPRTGAVPIAGTFILIIIGVLVAIYFINKKRITPK